MSTIWIYSDLHLGHDNIRRYCNRPFASVEEMDEALIDNHNRVVKVSDIVYNLGDVTMLRGGKVQQGVLKRWVQRLNGHKRLLLGNHDHFPVEAYLEAGFEKVKGTGQWLDGLILSHYPIHPNSMGRAQACIHGHIHQNPSYSPAKRDGLPNQPYVNVSVEVISYTPIALEEVKDIVRKLQ